MSQSTDKSRLQEWKEKLNQQKLSDLTITSWCRQHDISIQTFYYWKRKAAPKTTLIRSDFTEISVQQKLDPKSKEIGVSLEYHNFCIHLEKEFDRSALKQCLRILKELSC